MSDKKNLQISDIFGFSLQNMIIWFQIQKH